MKRWMCPFTTIIIQACAHMSTRLAMLSQVIDTMFSSITKAKHKPKPVEETKDQPDRGDEKSLEARVLRKVSSRVSSGES